MKDEVSPIVSVSFGILGNNLFRVAAHIYLLSKANFSWGPKICREQWHIFANSARLSYKIRMHRRPPHSPQKKHPWNIEIHQKVQFFQKRRKWSLGSSEKNDPFTSEICKENLTFSFFTSSRNKCLLYLFFSSKQPFPLQLLYYSN